MIAWIKRHQRPLLQGMLFVAFFLLSPASFYAFENRHYLSDWSLVLTLGCIVIGCAILAPLAVRAGAALYPTWPERRWFRRLNIMLHTHSKMAHGVMAVAMVAIFCGMSLGYDKGFMGAAVCMLVWVVAMYMLFMTTIITWALHYEGFALAKTKRRGVLSLHLTGVSGREAVGVLNQMDGGKLRAVLSDVRRMGFSAIEVVSPNPLLIRHAQRKLRKILDDAILEELASPALGRLKTLLFLFILGGRMKGSKEGGRLLQTGFLLKI